MRPAAWVIEVAAADVVAELERFGVEPDERVTLTIEPELIPGRQASRKLVVAAGLSGHSEKSGSVTGAVNIVVESPIMPALRLRNTFRRKERGYCCIVKK